MVEGLRHVLRVIRIASGKLPVTGTRGLRQSGST
jgi:hypothetical protein